MKAHLNIHSSKHTTFDGRSVVSKYSTPIPAHHQRVRCLCVALTLSIKFCFCLFFLLFCYYYYVLFLLLLLLVFIYLVYPFALLLYRNVLKARGAKKGTGESYLQNIQFQLNAQWGWFHKCQVSHISSDTLAKEWHMEGILRKISQTTSLLSVLFTFQSLFLFVTKCKKGLMATANVFLQRLMGF